MKSGRIGTIARDPRSLASILASASAVALAAGLFVQYALGHPPCSLCVLQRLAFAAVLLFTAPVAAFGASTPGFKVFGPLALLAVLCGIGVATHQVWVQAFPAEVARCGRGLAAYFDGLPVERLAGWLLAAEGDCARPVRLFGVTLAQLGLGAFVLMMPFAGRLSFLGLPDRPAKRISGTV